MFDALISVLKLLGNSLQWATQLGDEKRKKLAAQCDAIAITLQTFLNGSEDARKSRSLCEELRVNVRPIQDIAANTLAKDELESLALQLDSVCDAWNAHAKAAVEGRVHSADLDQVAVAVGHFRGLATRIRAI